MLKTMTNQVVQQMKKYPQIGTKSWNYKIAVKDLPVQIGSLTKLILQLHKERFAHGMTDKEIKDKISDELADILSLVLFISHELNIDIEEAWQGMLKSDERKFVKSESQ